MQAKSKGKSKKELLEIGKDTQFKSGRQAADAGRAGGIQSGIAKRKHRAFKELFLEYLAQPNKDNPAITNEDAIVMGMMAKAEKGDSQAYLAVRGTIGEEPEKKTEVKHSGGYTVGWMTQAPKESDDE